jgi:uncharacterized RDD family membrane protein YckC
MRSELGCLRIRTPEGISFSYQLAGPVSRMLAWVVDISCILGACAIAAQVLPGAALVIAYFVLSIGYGIAFEWLWRGQTMGKRILRLRVIDAQGLNLQFQQIALRNLLRMVDFFPALYLLGGTMTLLTSKAQRLGDIAAGTVVVRSPKVSQPDVDQILRGKYNSLRDYPHLAARLRHKTSPDAAALALEALLRRDEFDAGARVVLFGELAGYFRSVVEFPPEATEQIGDEQYIRNTVELLYR